MQLVELERTLNNKTAIIGVVGLGYVGLPVAASFADVGFIVIGVDINVERTKKINQGICPIEGDEPGMDELISTVIASCKLTATADHDQLSQADVILIDVETPVDANHQPNYSALRSACRQIAPVLKTGALVIVESTIAPGTMDSVVRPLIEQGSGGKVDVDFFLGVCPERVMPGKLLVNLKTMNRVCGATRPETAETMSLLYSQIVEADIDKTDMTTAEIVKTTENTYRDVQIAFANEIALICETLGSDVWRVRELVNKSPFREMHMPGAGVGGHCIPKDPWLLISGVKDRVPIRLIPQARAINDSMPRHMVDLLISALEEAEIEVNQAKVAILGYAYLENSDDARNSPSADLVKRLLELGAEVAIHDPWVDDYVGNLFELLQGSDAAVIMVAHDAYRTLDLAAVKDVLASPVLVDGRRIVSRRQAEAIGFVYRGVGEG